MSSPPTPKPELEAAAAAGNAASGTTVTNNNVSLPRPNPLPLVSVEPGNQPIPVPASIRSLSRRAAMSEHSNIDPLNPPSATSAGLTAPIVDAGPGAAMPRKRSIVIVDSRRASASTTTASVGPSNPSDPITSSNTPSDISSRRNSDHQLRDSPNRRASVAPGLAAPAAVQEESEGELSTSRNDNQVAPMRSEPAVGVHVDRLLANIQSTVSLMGDSSNVLVPMASKGTYSESATPADSQAALHTTNDLPLSSSVLANASRVEPSSLPSGRAIQPGSLSTASNLPGASKPNIAPLLMMAKRQPAGLTRSTSNAQNISPGETLPKTSTSLADDSYNPFGEPSPSSPLLQRTQTFRRMMSSASKSMRRHRADTDASMASSALDPNSPTGNQSYLAMAKKSEQDKDGEGKGAGKGAGKAPGGKPRRMSLGAALMMPPPPRTANAMDLKTIIKFTISAVGILYGDVAAAPMFVFKSVFRQGVTQSDPATDIYGALSMMFYTTLFLGIFKYCLVVLHADNNGEGGMLALLSLVPEPDDENCPPWLVKHYKKIFFLALTGCAFLLADGFVTPAISMLAALEGFLVAEAQFPDTFRGFPVDSWRVWLAMAMMFPLFYAQRFGLGRITQVFPVILTIWFLGIAIIGANNIYLVPDILNCLNPAWIIRVCILRGVQGSLGLLSTVLLVVSGLEFLYADLGAFTRKPIMLSFCIVCAPFTMLSYIGQGAYLLNAYQSNRFTQTQLQTTINNLFFEAAPSWLIWPLVVMGTLVSIAGSQSVISGCFAMLDQAISIRVIPPVESLHIVGAGGHGTYYTPSFCFVLFVGGIVLSAGYQSSDRLSEIIGFCVAGAMFITSVMIMTVMKAKWHWPNWKVAIYVVCVFSLDIVYLVAAFTKVFENAWVTVLYSAMIFCIMYVYVGTQDDKNMALEDTCWTMQQVRQHVRQNPRTKGCGVFIANHDEEVPHVLTMVASKLPALPEDLILLTVQCLKSQPFVSEDDRVSVRVVDPTHGVYRVLILFGFAERSADIMQSLAKAKKRGLRMKHEQGMTFYISKHSVQAMVGKPFYRRWKHKVYEVLARNTNTQLKTLGLPPDKVMEVSNVLLL